MMTSKHKWAKEMRHWAAGGIVQHRYKSSLDWQDCHRDCVNFGSNYEFRIKPELVIPKTRITESDYNFYKERIQSKLHPDHTTFFMMQKVMIEVAQESLRLAVENGDLIIPEKKNG